MAEIGLQKGTAGLFAFTLFLLYVPLNGLYIDLFLCSIPHFCEHLICCLTHEI
jgi:hypothetical protein